MISTGFLERFSINNNLKLLLNMVDTLLRDFDKNIIFLSLFISLLSFTLLEGENSLIVSSIAFSVGIYLFKKMNKTTQVVLSIIFTISLTKFIIPSIFVQAVLNFIYVIVAFKFSKVIFKSEYNENDLNVIVEHFIIYLIVISFTICFGIYEFYIRFNNLINIGEYGLEFYTLVFGNLLFFIGLLFVSYSILRNFGFNNLEFYSKFYSDISDIKTDANDLLNLQIGLFECGHFLRKEDGSFSIPFNKRVLDKNESKIELIGNGTKEVPIKNISSIEFVYDKNSLLTIIKWKILLNQTKMDVTFIIQNSDSILIEQDKVYMVGETEIDSNGKRKGNFNFEEILEIEDHLEKKEKIQKFFEETPLYEIPNILVEAGFNESLLNNYEIYELLRFIHEDNVYENNLESYSSYYKEMSRLIDTNKASLLVAYSILIRNKSERLPIYIVNKVIYNYKNLGVDRYPKFSFERLFLNRSITSMFSNNPLL